MTAGDKKIIHTSVANGAYLTIQPGAGEVWQIHNFYFGGDWELYRTDGTNTILVDSNSGPGSIQKRAMLANNTYYFRVKNVSGGSKYYGYDGLVLE